MKIWLSKNSDVPIREQLVTQIVLGIVSNDLKEQQRLPSTRDLARRYRVHANTVSAAYRELSRRGWVVFRKGSGVYVRAQKADNLNQKLALDQLVARFLKSTRAEGYSLLEIQSCLEKSLALQSPDHFLVIEPDEELRLILMAEIAEVSGAKVLGMDPRELETGDYALGATAVVLYGHAKDGRQRLNPTTDLIVIHSASIAESLRGQMRPPRDSLIAVVSRWPEFLRWAHTILIAAGLDADALSLRDAREQGWEKGLRAAAFVITDSLMASRIPGGCPLKVFRLTAESSLQEICKYAGQNF